MKIGILTYHWVYNYGANLQSYAVSEILKDRGNEVVVLNYIHLDLKDIYLSRIPQVQLEAHDNFVKNNLPITKLCTNEIELAEVCNSENLDGIIVGSRIIELMEAEDSLMSVTNFIKGLRKALDE